MKNFPSGRNFLYILGIVYITLLDKNSMLSGIAQGPVKSIHFAIVSQKGHEDKAFSANHKHYQVF